MLNSNLKQIIKLQTEPDYSSLYLEHLYVPDIKGYSVYKLKWWERMLSTGTKYMIRIHLKDDDTIHVALTQDNLDKLEQAGISEV